MLHNNILINILQKINWSMMVVSISDKVACTHLVVPYNITTIEWQDDGMVG